MNKNWEDEFDFEDQTANNKTKRGNDKKNKKNAQPSNEFQGLQLEQKNVKFPVINSKVGNVTEKSAKNMNKVNLEEISGKKEKKGRTQQPDQFEQIFQQSLAPATSPLKATHKQTQQKVKANTSTLKDKKLQQSMNQYANEGFDEAEYEEDFEAHEEKKKASPIIHKPKQEKEEPPKKSLNTINVPKPIQKNRKGAQSVMKNSDNTARVYTRNSARSQDRSFNSRTKIDQKKQDPSNKFTAIAQKNCPNYQKSALEEFNMDKLVRQNEKIRNTIKKFNDQLNDMINRNILLLKGKKEEKVVDQDELVKQLQQLKASNQTALQTTIKDLSKLKDKEGALREEEYHLTLDQKIQQSKNNITELSKAITKLNFDVSNEGNKLSKIDKSTKQGNPNTQINTVKLNLINMRKDEEKNEETNKKLELKLKQLTQKMAEVQTKFNQQVEGAKLKGINIVNNPQLVKKLEELKKKVDIGKQHKGKTQALFKTKSDMIAHQLQQIRAQIKNIQSSTLSVKNSCEQFQEQSRKVVEKAKKGGKVSTDLINSLQSIISQMQRGVSSSKESSEQQATFTHPKGAKKYQSLKNVEKVAVVSVTQRQPQKSQDDSNIKKPMLFKKKKQEDEKLEERVWKDEKPVSPPKNEKNRESAAELAKFQDKQPQRKDQQKKKPFAFKKNKDKTIEQQAKIQSPKPDVVKQIPKKEELKIQQPKKDEESINLAPRMMRFKKNKQQASKQEVKISSTNDKNTQITLIKQTATINNPVKTQQKEQENQIIVPKRFNLKLKDRKSQETGYLATNLQKKEQVKIQQPKRPVISLDQQKNAIKEVQKTINKIQASQEKPYFNLKLKDRQKEANRLQNKQQQKEKVDITKEQVEQPIKIPISLSDNPNPMKENSNPYVQQQGVKRQREGPLRKQKPQQVAKQQFSIFQQAGEIDI